MSDREEMQAARSAGLVKRHETREARAIRRQVAEEIARALEDMRPHVPVSSDPQRRERVVQRSTLNQAARVAREIGSKEASE